jgi:hypothetical protein
MLMGNLFFFASNIEAMAGELDQKEMRMSSGMGKCILPSRDLLIFQ